MKNRKSLGPFAVAVVLVSACTSDFPSSETEETNAGSQPITRGKLVKKNVDLEVVKLSLEAADPRFDDLCTGIKIGPRRFLTARHCLHEPGTPGSATNSKNGDGGSSFVVTTKRSYPSYAENLDTGHWTDVGIFDVDVDTPGIPSVDPAQFIDPTYIAPGRIGQVVAYGCDVADPSHAGKKQWGDMVVAPNSGASGAGYIFSTSTTDPVTCPGDSGGPMYFQDAAGNWRIGGIVASTDKTTVSWFARLARIREWILDPHENRFIHGSIGSLLSTHNNCLTSTADGKVRYKYCDQRDQFVDPQYWILQEVRDDVFRLSHSMNQSLCLSGLRDGTYGFTSCSVADEFEFVNPRPAAVGTPDDHHRFYNIQNSGGCLTLRAPNVDGALLTQSQSACTSSNGFLFVR